MIFQYADAPQFVHLQKDILTDSKFWQLQVKLLKNICVQIYVCTQIYKFFG